MRDDGEDARRFLRRRHVDRFDRAGGNRAHDERRIGHVLEIVLGGILRAARHFAPAVNAVDGTSNLRNGHAAPPLRSVKARTNVRFASSILNPFWPYDFASFNSASAAARNTSAVTRWPVRAASALRARQGFVPT